MPDAGKRVAVLSAMPSELSPLVRLLHLRPERGAGPITHRGRVGANEIVAGVTGIGPAAATEVTDLVLDAFETDLLLMIGVAGGLRADLRIGELVVPAQVVDHTTGAQYSPEPLEGLVRLGTLLTTPELVADPVVLATLRLRGIDALDMETAALAASAERHGRRWSVIRVVSDHVDGGLVDGDVLGLTRADGSADVRAVVHFVRSHRRGLRTLAQLARDYRSATGTLARAAATVCRAE